MTDALKKELSDWGVDVESALERFMGNEALFARFLQKFLSDPNMGLLKEALAQQDAAAAFQACHALKGVAGNLSLNGFLPEVKELTEVLRAGSLEGTQALMDKITPSYERLCDILQQSEVM